MTFRARMASFLPPLLPLILSICVAETAVRMAWVPSYLIPAPSEVFHSLLDDRLELALAAWETLSSALVGSPAQLCRRYDVLRGALLVRLGAPRFLSLRGFLSNRADYFDRAPAGDLVRFRAADGHRFRRHRFGFSDHRQHLLGLKSTEPSLVDLFKLYSATGRQTLWMLKIPFALPQIFSGLRIASGLAIVGAIVGEFIGGGGLGSVVDSARTQQRIDRVFAAVLISSLLGIVLVGAVNLVSSLSLGSWHTSERKSS